MNGLPFYPIQGTEAIIAKTKICNGFLYFATDSGKMYLDTENERISVGGTGAAVLYAEAENVQQDLTDLAYIISFSALENGSKTPRRDDLIINTDGTFYKVISYDKDNEIIRCKKIAVSGTGGGSGDTPLPDGRYLELTYQDYTPDSIKYVHKQSSIIKFYVEASDDAYIIVNYYVTNKATQETKNYSHRVASGDVDSFDLGAILDIGMNTLVVEAISGNSGSKRLEYLSIECYELLLKKDNNFSSLNLYDTDLTFSYIPIGPAGKKIKVYLDDTLIIDQDSYLNNQSESVKIPKQPHGVYNLKAQLEYQGSHSDILEYSIAFKDEDNDAPLVWFNQIPTEIFEYDHLKLEYMIYDPNSIKEVVVKRYVNNVEFAEEIHSYSTSKWILWSISNFEIGNNTITISCGSSSSTISINVIRDVQRNLNVLTGFLDVNLITSGRSNAENENARKIWQSNTTKATLNNFNWYNNGWIFDESINDSVLRISNGASVSIPLNIMNVSPLESSITFEIRFKLRNVQEYKTLTNKNLDAEGEVIGQNYDSVIGVWGKYFNDTEGIGFCFGTQESFFKSKQVLIAGRYEEDEIVTVSFVLEKKTEDNEYPLLLMYINGILSAIEKYDIQNDSFLGKMNSFDINSTYCDVDIYNIRVYSTGLTTTGIVQNYIADKRDSLLYDMNSVIDLQGTIPQINYEAMLRYNDNNPDNLLLPYAVIETISNDDMLPYVKGGKKRVNVTFVNPALDKAYNDKVITDQEYLTKCPSFVAKNVEFDVQGTSSQGYPRRNYKGKFKKEINNHWQYTNGPLKGKEIGEENVFNDVVYKNYYMDNTYSESSFTWKADYMESSMSHNTGFANFAKGLYSKHPLQDLGFEKEDVKDRRTTIYGFPMIVFQKKKNGSHEFIGRYNFNLDKGCNNVIGFNEKIKHPYVDGDKPIADIAECWEFLHNQAGRVSFQRTEFDEIDSETKKLTVIEDFAYRYHPQSDVIDDILELKGKYQNYTQEQINQELSPMYDNLEKVVAWVASTNTEAATGQSLGDNKYTAKDGTVYEVDTREYRLKKFFDEFSDWFDLEYCAIYFIMTELLLCYDSRGKNMMLASWGPQKQGGNYIWYPLFYDIDTQLGVNNSGVPSWEYNIDPSQDNIFSTPHSVLWNNFEAVFMDYIQLTYQNLRKNHLTEDKLKGSYNYDPVIMESYAMMGNRPLNFVNVDQYWKYIAPTFSGYIDTEGKVANDAGSRFYCLQGTRQLQRDLFLRNRLNYVDSKWCAGAYAATAVPSEFKIRANLNRIGEEDNPETSDVLGKGIEKEGDSESPLNGKLIFQITPYLDQYVSLWHDAVLQNTPQHCIGKNQIELNAKYSDPDDTTPLPDQLFYIGGGEYISSLGDLSRLYLSELTITPLKRLKYLQVGNDHSGYYNNLKLEGFALNAGSSQTTVTKPLLETVILSNMRNLNNNIDVSGSEKLKEFRALGTNITGVSLASGSLIETLHLPATVTKLVLTEATKLNTVITDASAMKDSYGNFINNIQGLYIDGIFNDGQPISSLESLQIIGGNMNYGSYQLMTGLMNLNKSSMAFSLKDIQWSPYKKVPIGSTYDSTKTYVLKTDYHTFENYEEDKIPSWEEGLLYELIYVKDSSIDITNGPTNIEFLEDFTSPANLAESTNKFKDVITYSDGRVTYPYLSGDIYINNSKTDDDPISDYALWQLCDNYYPNLNITVARGIPANTLKLVEIITDQITGEKKENTLQIIKYQSNETIDNTKIITPSKLHHTFIGWSETANGEKILTPEEINNLQFSSEEQKTIKLYANYDWEYYRASFYNGNQLIGTTDPVKYGEYFYEIKILPSYQNNINLPLTERYAFKGWSETQFDNPIFQTLEDCQKHIVDISLYKSTEPKSFYAVFVKENVLLNATDNKYFNFEELGDGYRISANKDYELQGKITLPIKYKEKYITEIGDFTSILTTATHVFFINKNDGDISRYTTVGTRAFGGEDNNEYTLIGIYLPNTITTFNSYAFQYLSSLKDISENAINNEYKLPNSLITINSYACRKTSLRLTTLSNCLQLDTIGMHGMSSCGTDVTFNAFPDSLTTIGSSALAHLEAINITSTNAIIKIGSLGLYNSSKKTTQLTLEQPLAEIGAEAFHLFGQRNNLQVTNNSKISDIEPYFTNMITNSSLIGGN